MAQKTVLIVYAHQSPGSFNAAVRDAAMEELKEQGYSVLVSDLYAMNFRANATQDDIIGFTGHIQLGGEPGVDPELSLGITYPIWDASESPRRSWKTLLERGTSGSACLACCHCDPTPSVRESSAHSAHPLKGDLKNPELFQYGDETMHAWMEGHLSEDITAEHKKVEAAELIIFQFPLYWFSVPAIMKGWIDRVLTQGFAFSLEKIYNNGIFKDKKAMLSFTTGATQTMFRPDGINGDINVILWPLQNGTLHFCGFQVLAPQIFWSPAHCPPVARTAMLDGWRARLKGLLEEKPLTFAPCELFDLSFQGGFMLWPKVREERESQPYGLTTGHHLGKPLPPDNQITAQSTVESSANADCRK